MNKFELEVPIAFIIFNRIDTTQLVFEQIRNIQPKKLYLISDAARSDKEGEADKVAEVRKYVQENIDWNCEVHKNYAVENMGCKKRVSSGISWVFEQEEEAIILEDDCIPNSSFFRYCQEMLNKYRDFNEIMLISGTNLLEIYDIKEDYIFSKFGNIWGWATWKRAWGKYDIKMMEWPEVKKNKSIEKRVTKETYNQLKNKFDLVYKNQIDTWDYQWDFTRMSNNGLAIIPKYNLISNVGFGRADATHTKGESEVANLKTKEMKFPIKNDVKIYIDEKYDLIYQKRYFDKRIKLSSGLIKIWMLCKKYFRK